MLETQVEEIRKQISNLHNSSMAFVNEILTALERRLTDKLEEQTQQLNARIDGMGVRRAADRLTLGIAVVGWLVAIALALWHPGHP